MGQDFRDSLTQVFMAPPDQTGNGGQPQLVAVSGPRQGMIYPLAEGQTTIGRKPFNSIILPSTGVSKTHCIITREGGECFISDNESTNGTFVNGRKLSAMARLRLVHGDSVGVFDTTFLFLNPPDHGDMEAAEELRIDFKAAASEAESLLRTGAEAQALRNARRRRAP